MFKTTSSYKMRARSYSNQSIVTTLRTSSEQIDELATDWPQHISLKWLLLNGNLRDWSGNLQLGHAVNSEIYYQILRTWIKHTYNNQYWELICWTSPWIDFLQQYSAFSSFAFATSRSCSALRSRLEASESVDCWRFVRMPKSTNYYPSWNSRFFRRRCCRRIFVNWNESL